MIFFCIFSISSLSAIFIMTSRLLQSDDDLFLRRYFLIDNSSLVMFIHDMIFIEKRVFLCICNCLLSSWTDVFSFYMFFMINAFWVMWCFSSDSSWRQCISFTATSFYEWSLLFFFSNVNVYIRKSIMLITYFLSLREFFNLTLLFLHDKLTLLAIVFESALLQFMQFIIVYLIDNEIHLYVMSTTNLLILFYVWIKVRRIKRSQFNAVQIMLERCVIRKVVMQSFHSCDNILSNSHNQSTKKINDMSMSKRWKDI